MLPFFEDKRLDFSCSSLAQIDFPTHLHYPVELFYVCEGATEVLIGAEQYTVSAGGLAVIFPGKVHAYHTLIPGRNIMLIASGALAPQLAPLLKEKQPAVPFLGPAAVPPHLAENLEELVKTPDRTLGCALSQLILTRLLCRLPLEPRPAHDADDLLYQALSVIGSDYKTTLTLHSVAERLGVSECHLSRTLRSGTGIGFRAYINSLRVADARRLLAATDRSILEISMECGFENLRTFNRAFLEVAQCSPRAYRRAAL